MDIASRNIVYKQMTSKHYASKRHAAKLSVAKPFWVERFASKQECVRRRIQTTMDKYTVPKLKCPRV